MSDLSLEDLKQIREALDQARKAHVIGVHHDLYDVYPLNSTFDGEWCQPTIIDPITNTPMSVTDQNNILWHLDKVIEPALKKVNAAISNEELFIEQLNQQIDNTKND